MNLQQSNQSSTATRPQAQACGSIIDAQGREIPITEKMIQQACQELETSRVKKVQKG